MFSTRRHVLFRNPYYLRSIIVDWGSEAWREFEVFSNSMFEPGSEALTTLAILMGGALLLRYLEFSDEEKLTAVVPYLETDDSELRRVLREILRTVDRPDGDEPDFAAYVTYLREVGDDPPLALIRYMYEVSPDRTRSALARVDDDGRFCDSIEWEGPESLCEN